VHEIELTNPLCGFSLLGSIEALHWHPVRVSDHRVIEGGVALSTE
jgi:hypothetical protein